MSKYICVDFDGTIVKHRYPEIGDRVPGALPTLRQLRQQNHKIILFTMRSGDLLQDAVDYIQGHGIQLFGVNHNPTQDEWTDSPKAYGHLYIDDSAVGAPILTDDKGRGFVDWDIVKTQLQNKGLI